MGMTIDKAIAKIWHCIVSIRDCTGNKEFVEALELSVATMRKYQKIQEIIADWSSDGGAFEMSEPYWLRLISEVVEDENND